MQRRYFPYSATHSILLYGLGLALTLSLLFNGYLLYEQGLRRNRNDTELGSAAYTLSTAVWQQQLSDCQLASQRKDSLIHRMEELSHAPPGTGAYTRQTSSR